MMENIFRFFDLAAGISLYKHPVSSDLLGNPEYPGYVAACPLVFPQGHDMMTGNPHLILRSSYILGVIKWLILSGATHKEDENRHVKVAAWVKSDAKVAAKQWNIKEVMPGLIACAATFMHGDSTQKLVVKLMPDV